MRGAGPTGNEVTVMSRDGRGRCARRGIELLAVLATILWAPAAAAQLQAAVAPASAGPSFGTGTTSQAGGERGVEAKGTLGISSFIDENFDEHFVAGVSVRLPLTERTSIEPEFTYMRAGAADQDFFLRASIVYDLAHWGRATPYVIGGGGIFWQRTSGLGPGGNLVFTSSEATAAGGLGLRLRLAQGWTLAPEARMGWEPLFQVTASVGYAF
jgi:opacity protein-like surface antigen